MLADAITVAVAVAGLGLLVLAVRQARSKGAAAALHLGAAGFALIGASAIGIVEFLAGVVLSPVGWVGAGLLGLAGVLFVVGQRLEGRPPRQQKGVRQSGPEAKRQVGPASRKAPGTQPATSGADDDMADIEAILRRHGIE